MFHLHEGVTLLLNGHCPVGCPVQEIRVFIGHLVGQGLV